MTADSKTATNEKQSNGRTHWANADEAIHDGFRDQTYMDLMDRWMDLDRQLEHEAGRLATLYQEKKKAQEELDDLELDIILAAGGRGNKELGSNAEQRADAIANMLRRNATYQKQRLALAKAESAHDECSNKVDALRSRLSGTAYAMRMHAARLIASSAVTMALPLGNGYHQDAVGEVNIDGIDL